ncbi:MAG: ATP-binding cassette domain-containing protein, partial [Anaerolineaceae bacterium]|nr:ATP-binding cassette domain-containing protein [Anaerolineaceae bacterium]
MSEKEVLLSVRDLKKYFPVSRGLLFNSSRSFVHAVDGISFDIFSGETLGLVGESGCGKSTTGRIILQLEKPTSGSVIFQGRDLTKIRGEELRSMRKDFQMIFQDPFASLNPRMTVSQIISEPMIVHNTMKGEALTKRVRELLDLVGLNPA